MRPILLCALTLLLAGCGRSGEDGGNAGMNGANAGVAEPAAEAWDADPLALPAPPPPPPFLEPSASGNAAAPAPGPSSEQRDWLCLEPRAGVRHCVDMTPMPRPEIPSLPPARWRPALGPAASPAAAPPSEAPAPAAPPSGAADQPPGNLSR